jgi:hypothetical protein
MSEELCSPSHLRPHLNPGRFEGSERECACPGEADESVTPPLKKGSARASGVRGSAWTGSSESAPAPPLTRTYATCPIRVVRKLSRLARLRPGTEWFVIGGRFSEECVGSPSGPGRGAKAPPRSVGDAAALPRHATTAGKPSTMRCSRPEDPQQDS